MLHRTAATSNTVSQTAAATDSAEERASIPAHVTLGRIANTAPAHTAVVRPENCLAKTTTPAAAAPMARQLGSRDHNSVGGNMANQPCINR
ncbi:Uncharacterised protein [Mycobacterium tuberculosis]|uniref:Uncharacterized protein n=1 Tax=Mycobacterium tuberculosis TaxID=1773 RepID=A0A0T9XKM2_MYCTX|nr:Uncharacterised protein [Mycobacterium tuberculosis]CKS04600.1 Uncharacterised protein [Mycobacterium tuberculosis]CKS94214.1 Uncharacterised protein [Mycobacterium tuberculosis]CKT91068.1 Uncharacterised protein [Mycobacterium tuberculosis]CNU18381.1 Uncharacterised protein [Mycobacterium tuberculosis]